MKCIQQTRIKHRVMKFIKTYLSILLLAMATTSFGIHHRITHKAGATMHVIRDMKVAAEDLPVESWMINPFKEVIIEKDIYVENWMVTPFESPAAEEIIYLESWMSTPFDVPLVEGSLQVEGWMSTPFVISLKEEKLELEEWMTIPMWC